MWRALLKRISWVSGGHAAIARRVFLCAGHHGWYSPKLFVGKQVVVRAASRIAGKVNAAYNVAGLCHELPARIEELARRGGGKLAK